jgi:hypothetical protein
LPEARGDDEYVAAFVGEYAIIRSPATELCSTPDGANEWINAQAAAFGLPVRWIDAAPRR